MRAALRPWLLATASLVALSLMSLARGQTDGAALLEEIRARRDAVSSQTFYELAAARDAEAFGALREGLEFVEDQGAVDAGFGAASLFRGTTLEARVVDWLVDTAFRSERKTHQLAAARALRYFWRTDERALLRVLKNHPREACRAAVLPPLLPQLVAKGDRSSCKLVLENVLLETRSERAAALAALRGFDSSSCRELLARRLREQSLATERKLLLLDLFAEDDTDFVLAAVEKRLGDPLDAVRLRAIEVLGRQRDGETLRHLEKVAQYGDEAFVVGAITLLASQREADRAWVEQLYGFTSNQSPIVRLGATRALGRLPTQDALTLLHRLLLDEDRRVQLAALEAVGAKRQQRSISRLIAALAVSDGISAAELARQLRLFTGLDHGSSAARWRAWFEAEGASFQMPTRAEAERLEAERAARRNEVGDLRTASFYGLRIQSDRVTFVIDLSGSMAAPASGRGTTARARTRLAVAKEELRGALSQLLYGVRFNLISFSSDTDALAPRLIELDAETRMSALERIEGWAAHGGTAVYDGLTRALDDPETDTIYLLTDGEATMGEVTSPKEIRRRIGELCKLRGVRIHGISIGRRSGLLKGLAKDTGGQYVEIL